MPLSKIDLRANNPEKNALWTEVPQSLLVTNFAINPASNAIVVQIEGFNTWKDHEVWRLDWLIWQVGGGTPIALDMQIKIADVEWGRLPLIGAINVQTSGTAYLKPVNRTISINAINGNANMIYIASMTMTRMLNGFRVG